MNIYKSLNDITKYIDDNLEENIKYDTLAKMIGINTYTLQRLFSILTGISLAEYIRKRRLSTAGYDLYQNNGKIIGGAIKYQYDNATSFSRAFEKFHGIKPSLVNKETKLRNFPRIIFDEQIDLTAELDYEIISLEEFHLYGLHVETNNETIGVDAPRFFQEMTKKYYNKYGKITYGMVTYDKEREECEKYYCLFDKKINSFEHINIPKSKWLKFQIKSQNAKEIQEMSHKF